MVLRFKNVLLFISCAAIMSLFPANGATCVDGAALSTFLATGFSCTIGDKIFSDFTYTSSAQGGATAVQASGISVNTLGPSGTGAGGASLDFPADIGLAFNASWIASGANAFTDSIIGFTVTVVNGANMLIKDAGVAQLAGAFSTGVASVAEKGCGPVPCQLNQWGVLTLDTSSYSSSINGTIFTPVGSIRVQKDISVNAGTAADGFAHLSRVADTFSQVPEPRAISFLLGLGLVGFSLRKKLQPARL